LLGTCGVAHDEQNIDEKPSGHVAATAPSDRFNAGSSRVEELSTRNVPRAIAIAFLYVLRSRVAPSIASTLMRARPLREPGGDAPLTREPREPGGDISKVGELSYLWSQQ